MVFILLYGRNGFLKLKYEYILVRNFVFNGRCALPNETALHSLAPQNKPLQPPRMKAYVDKTFFAYTVFSICYDSSVAIKLPTTVVDRAWARSDE